MHRHAAVISGWFDVSCMSGVFLGALKTLVFVVGETHMCCVDRAQL